MLSREGAILRFCTVEGGRIGAEIELCAAGLWAEVSGPASAWALSWRHPDHSRHCYVNPCVCIDIIALFNTLVAHGKTEIPLLDELQVRHEPLLPAPPQSVLVMILGLQFLLLEEIIQPDWLHFALLSSCNGTVCRALDRKTRGFITKP